MSRITSRIEYLIPTYNILQFAFTRRFDENQSSFCFNTITVMICYSGYTYWPALYTVIWSALLQWHAQTSHRCALSHCFVDCPLTLRIFQTALEEFDVFTVICTKLFKRRPRVICFCVCVCVCVRACVRVCVFLLIKRTIFVHVTARSRGN